MACSAASAAADATTARPVCAAAGADAAPWTERHRPRHAAPHVGVAQSTLCDLAQQGACAHVACYGPPGTGKTTAIMAFARAVSGCPPDARAEEGYPDRIMRLNGSEERTTGMLASLLENFVRRSPLPGGKRRVVFIDEIDGMPAHTQHLLVAFMEAGAKNGTCFAFAFNEPASVLEHIVSRCYMVFFKLIDREVQLRILADVLAAEGAGAHFGEEGGALDAVIDATRGDMRAAINLMELVVYGRGRDPPPASAEDVFRLADVRGELTLEELLTPQGWDARRALDFFRDRFEELRNADLIVGWIVQVARRRPADRVRLAILEAAAELEERCSAGKTSTLQFHYFVALLDRAFSSTT